MLSLALLALAAASVQADFNPNYYNQPWNDTCKNGRMQTPIDIHTRNVLPLPASLVTDIKMPVASGPIIKNTGSGIQVEWESLVNEDLVPRVPVGGEGISDVLMNTSIPVQGTVRVVPVQFHVHTVSEHAMDGAIYGAETHIVSLIAKGERPEWGCDDVWDGGDPVLERCAAVFGMMYKLGSSTPTYLRNLIDTAPAEANSEVPWEIEDFPLDELLPESTEYYSYIGSLTVPDCNEGLRWHVMSEVKEIGLDYLEKYQDWIGAVTGPDGARNNYRTNYRVQQPLNSRTVYIAPDPKDVSTGPATTPPPVTTPPPEMEEAEAPTSDDLDDE